MVRSKRVLFVVLMGVLLVSGCEREGGPEGPERAEEASVAPQQGAVDEAPGIPGFRFGIDNQQGAQSDLPEVDLDPVLDPSEVVKLGFTSPSRVSVPEEPYEGAHDREVPISAAQYRDKMVEGICLGFQECKNQELTMAAFSLFITQLAEMELDDETDSKLADVVHHISQEQRLPTPEDCATVFGAVLDTTNFGPESLERYLEAGSIGFNEEAAGQCVAQFGRPFPLCLLEREITPRPDMQMFMMNVMQHQRSLETHFGACSEVIEGKLPEGASCEEPFQCAGERMFCQPDYPGGPGRCLRAPMGMGGMGGPGGPAMMP